MKGVLTTVVLGLGLMGLIGCATVPRHYTYVQEVVIYYPPPPPPPPDYYYPPVPPTPPVHKPPAPVTRPINDRRPETPKDSYQQRDPLRGGGDRGNGVIKTDPPIRKPVGNNRSN
jgi:hypothetical protein